MARNSAFNSLMRKHLRRARKLHFDFGTGKVSIPVIIVPTQISPEMLVSSMFKLWHVSPFQKQVLNEAKKVRERILKLQKEGYTFPDYIMDLVFGDEITISKKTLNKLKQMDMYYLRTHAASYQGETDINKIIAKHNREVAEKRRRTQEAKRKKNKDGAEQTSFDDKYVPTDLQVKIDHIMEEEMNYLQEIATYRGVVDPDVFAHAAMAANEVLRLVNTSTDEEKEIIIDFWEQNGGLSGVIESASTRFRGLFYEDYAVGFNLNFMELTPYGKESWFKDLFPDEEPSGETEFIPVGDEEDIPFD